MKITQAQKLKITAIAQKFHLKLIIVFGSFANGKQRLDSDLDIAVFGMENVPFSDQISLTVELSSVFKHDVDLSVLNRANPLLLFEASKNSILLYGRREDFLKLKLHAFNAYHDYAPYFALENNLNKKIISAYVH